MLIGLLSSNSVPQQQVTYVGEPDEPKKPINWVENIAFAVIVVGGLILVVYFMAINGIEV